MQVQTLCRDILLCPTTFSSKESKSVWVAVRPRARRNAGADCDYDIMVVVAQSDEPAYRRAQRAHSLLRDLGAAADILVDAWAAELDRRVRELDAGTAKTIPWEQVRSETLGRLRSK